MELTRNKKIMIAIAYTATAVAVGRYTVPLSVKTVKDVTKTEIVNKAKDSKKDKDKTTVIDTTEETKVDGTKVKHTKTTIEDKTVHTINSSEKSNTSEKDKESKIEVANTGKFNISILGGVNVTDPNGLVFGAHVTRDIIGPLNIGIFGLSDGVCGASVGLSF